MNKLAFFPNQEHDHAADNSDAKSPDPAELQRLLGTLADAIGHRPARNVDREIRIRNFRSERFTLRDDLIVTLEERGNQYVATSFDTGQYSVGFSPEDAISNLCSMIEDYYALLIEEQERLSAPLQAHLGYLRSILQER
jgi:hypothetical protein